jgi:hypothetical protein
MPDEFIMASVLGVQPGAAPAPKATAPTETEETDDDQTTDD